MDKEDKPSIWWQRSIWFFVLLAILPGVVPRSPGLYPVTSRRVAAFCIGCFLIGIVGWGATTLIKRILYPPPRKIKNAAQVGPTSLVMPLPGEAVVSSHSSALTANPWDSVASGASAKAAASLPPPPPDMPRFSARYKTTGADFWHFDSWSLVFHNSTRTAFFSIPATIVVLSLIVTIRISWPAVWKTTVGIFLAWCVFIAVFAVVQYRKFFPTRNTVRYCEVILTPEGLYDITPSKTAFVRWGQVQAVRQYKDQMYVYWPQNAHSFPVDGFENENDAQVFFDAAQTLWKSRGTKLPEVLVVPVSPQE